MSARPLVSVFSADDSSKVMEKGVPLPGVFTAPIRDDIVSFVHANLSKNSRQAHGVDPRAGMKHSAESWGTGRAVARIPRVSGSGTSRNGQAAFGNMCRKGRMFAPLKTWRRWHRKVNVTQRRHAVASALAASALNPLVLARGHRTENIPEMPLVVEDRIESYEKTKEAVEFLERFGAYTDVQKVVDNKRIRAGKGKLRNRRYRLRKGPLVVYSNENVTLVQAFRNLPGVEVANVNRLNLRQLAPGGHMGRLIVWTQSAFKALDSIFGSYRKTGVQKSGYQLQRHVLSNADIARIINSNEVQNVVRPARDNKRVHEVQKKNPLKNRQMMDRLNPNATLLRSTETRNNNANTKRRQEELAKKRGCTKSMTADQKKEQKSRTQESRKWFKNTSSKLNEAFTRDANNDAEYKATVKTLQYGIDGQW